METDSVLISVCSLAPSKELFSVSWKILKLFELLVEFFIVKSSIFHEIKQFIFQGVFIEKTRKF
jgi:hypothetical protein